MNLEKLKEEIDKLYAEDIAQLFSIVMASDQVIIIGNGGSNAVASHIAQDYTKQLRIPSITFSDPSRLTCYINDYGMGQAYAQFLSEFTTAATLTILISSSGNSENIINCAKYCYDNHRPYVLLTGFEEANQLKRDYEGGAELSFWVDSSDYGIVETMHQIILHSIL